MIERLKNKYLRLREQRSNRKFQGQIAFITSHKKWVVNENSRQLTPHLPYECTSSFTPKGFEKKLLHFGSIHTFYNDSGLSSFSDTCPSVVSWMHVEQHDPRLEKLAELDQHATVWHTMTTLSKSKLIKHGISEDRLHVIPLGINTKAFRPQPEIREQIRQQLKIPKDHFVIGSFQKDGTGWGKGLQPKLIKGPDIFCDVMENLHKDHKIFVLLTGPTRGYVMNRLSQAGIPFQHRLVDPYEKLCDYYNALDAYLVASRVEGGPLAVLEAPACSVPLVSTNVGMTHDLITNEENALVRDVEDSAGLTEALQQLITDVDLRRKISERGPAFSANYDWSIIAKEFNERLYLPILKRRGLMS